MPYISNTDDERAQMLEELGLHSVEELFSDIPAELRCRELDVPAGVSEMDVRRSLHGLAEIRFESKCGTSRSYRKVLPIRSIFSR